MSSRTLWALISAAAMGTAVWFATPNATACGTAIREAVDDHAIRVSAAERQLGEGKFELAAREVSDAFPGLKLYEPGTGPLADRSLRILSLAVARANGNLTAGAFQGKTAENQAQNLEWSVKTLRALNEKRPNNPALESDLGEALARVDTHKDEATKILSSLAERDLLASPEGYAALAVLRAGAGDSSGSESAIKRCQAMTKTAKVCAVATSVAS